MIPTVDHGRGFEGILRYAIEKDGAYLIGPVQGPINDLVVILARCVVKTREYQTQ